ncbi:MAG: lamin tail domain-containing protein [Chloroflexi bacterium]|nr:MAG: lamin tail domain-containing protein [Chloroflexota bacterium]
MMNSRVRPLAVVRLSLALMVVLGGLAGLALVLRPGAMAQGVDVEISQLSCNANPELVVVTNKGATPVDMTGWNLQSDPTTSESLPLQQFGSLSAGATVTVQSGPKAEGSFVWSHTELFRDNDPSDFAQLASDAGQVLLKVNCAAAAQQSATPTAAATRPAATVAAATASPAALSPASQPSGGGPPDAATSISPALLMFLGSWFLTGGLGTFALSFRGSRRSASVLALAEPQAVGVPAKSTAEVSTSGRRVTADKSAGYILFVGIALLLGAVFLALQVGGRKEK